MTGHSGGREIVRDRQATQEDYNGEGSEARRPRAAETQADQANGFSLGHALSTIHPPQWLVCPARTAVIG
jgi:hypothetical protein